jgi:hypothetical protein
MALECGDRLDWSVCDQFQQVALFLSSYKGHGQVPEGGAGLDRRVPPELRVLGGSNSTSFHPHFGGEVRQRFHSG